jgi:hypothetical protein
LEATTATFIVDHYQTTGAESNSTEQRLLIIHLRFIASQLQCEIMVTYQFIVQ